MSCQKCCHLSLLDCLNHKNCWLILVYILNYESHWAVAKLRNNWAMSDLLLSVESNLHLFTLVLIRYTPNANMADHSVVARDES